MKHAATKSSCMFILSGSSFSTAKIKNENPIHFRLSYELNQTCLKFYYIYISLFVFKGKAPIIFPAIFFNRFYGSDIVFFNG